MSIQELENAVAQLSQEERRQFAAWLADFLADEDNDDWDRQIARDLKAGRLDDVIARTEAGIAAGKARPL